MPTIGLPLYFHKRKIAAVHIDKKLFSNLRPMLALMRHKERLYNDYE